jgi:hypothetical protein
VAVWALLWMELGWDRILNISHIWPMPSLSAGSDMGQGNLSMSQIQAWAGLLCTSCLASCRLKRVQMLVRGRPSGAAIQQLLGIP